MVHETSEPKEITIDGRIYDVSSLEGKHPGGGVFKFYFGSDATVAFNEFHGRSPRAYKWLKTLKSRPATQPLSPLERDFRIFRQQLVDEGYFEPSYIHLAYRFAFLFFCHWVAFKLMFAEWYFTAALCLGYAGGHCGWLMHEFGHGSGTGYMWLDRRIQEFVYGVGDGMSAGWWRSQHNRHHAMPQHLEHDVDLKTLPLVAFHAEIAKKGNPFWLRFQAYLFLPVVTLLVTLGWQFFLHPRYMIRKGKWAELFYLAVRYGGVAYFVLPHLGLAKTLMMYIGGALFGGMYIFTNFALSHTHKPVVHKGETKDWIRFSVEHTTNISPGNWFITYFVMTHLNQQIEHHLFPQMPQYRFFKLVPRVRKWVEDHGLEYDTRGYFETLWDTLRNLDEVGKSAGEHAHKE
ncbi:delta-5 desaturase [Thecamonas trahens ATCC 50062]|uniref:Delta-5 desaturase n=1 Tax=Thecamonas trahens ATCC 50062 TaxID=461836 RepID=A0A0L0DMY0_THETB|nr:delta-5 desaturase [Thecamonas trahens ATCC 50062]KNC53610.1 delta-5 desaturase [Thecamonas trahens ATCC 50062]|eukprot:XP_013761927.1 delta-5 desaturase [Thecamonas trahens ATCC 50062]